jgi:hypothetical protein
MVVRPPRRLTRRPHREGGRSLAGLLIADPGKRLYLSPRFAQERRICRSGTSSPRLGELLPCEHPSLVAGSGTAVCLHEGQRDLTPGLAAQTPPFCLHGVELDPRNRGHLGCLAAHAAPPLLPLPPGGNRQKDTPAPPARAVHRGQPPPAAARSDGTARHASAAEPAVTYGGRASAENAQWTFYPDTYTVLV